MKEIITFSPLDAWIFFSIAWSAKDGVSSLDGLISTMDWINHGLPELKEINGSLKRLMRAGLINNLSLTAEGEKLFQRADKAGKVIRRKIGAIEKELMGKEWPVKNGKTFRVTAAEFSKTFNAYLKRMRGE